MIRRDIRWAAAVASVAFLAPAIAFIQFPLNGSLYGNIDIWYFVWLSEDVFRTLLGQESMGQVLYPEVDLDGLQGTQTGVASLYCLIRLIVSDPVWTFFVITHLITALNALSFFVLGRSLRIRAAILTPIAIAFAFNNFVWSNIENFDAYALFPSLLAAGCFLSAHRSTDRKRMYLLLLSGLFAGIQLHFSIYFFIFQFLLFPLLFLSTSSMLRSCWSIRSIAIWVVPMLLLISPFALEKRVIPEYLSSLDVLDVLVSSHESHSISLFGDYLRADPGNLFLPVQRDIPNPWRYAARSGFFGFSTYVLALSSMLFLLFVRRRMAVTILFTIVGFMILSSGPFLTIGSWEIRSPVGWVYEHIPSTVFIRHFFRAHLLVVTLALLSIALAGHLASRTSNGRTPTIIALVFGLLFSIENLPWRMRPFEQSDMWTVPDALRISEEREDVLNVHVLPSCHLMLDERTLASRWNSVNREFILMNWANDLDINLFNGQLAYAPQQTFENTLLTCALTSIRLDSLIRHNDIDAFVVVPRIALPGEMERVDEAFRGWTPEIVDDGAIYWVTDSIRNAARGTHPTSTTHSTPGSP